MGGETESCAVACTRHFSGSSQQPHAKTATCIKICMWLVQ